MDDRSPFCRRWRSGLPVAVNEAASITAMTAAARVETVIRKRWTLSALPDGAIALSEHVTDAGRRWRSTGRRDRLVYCNRHALFPADMWDPRGSPRFRE